MSNTMIDPPLPHLTGQKISNQRQQQQRGTQREQQRTPPTPVQIVFNVGSVFLAYVLFYLSYRIYPAAIYARGLNGAHNLLVACIVFCIGGAVLMSVSLRKFMGWYEYRKKASGD